MPPKRKVVAKKAVVTEEIPELNVVKENGNTLNEPSHVTIQRNVGRTLDNEVNCELEKLRMFEDRMANANNTKVEMEKMLELPRNVINSTLSYVVEEDKKDLKQLKSSNTRPKRVIAEKNVKEVKNPRKRAISEDRQTQVEVKSRRKQGKVESAVSPLVEVTKKKILRSASVDRLASAKPITIDVKNKNNKKPKIPDDSSKLPQRLALKKKEELPSKPKKTKKNVLNTEENVSAVSPPDKLKIKGSKKKQVFIDKEAVNLDTLQELPKQTGKTKTALKKSKPPTNKIKKVLKGDLKAPKEINKPDEKLEESTDKNDSGSSDNDTVPDVKVVKRPNNIKKQPEIEQKDVEGQLNEAYVISDDNVLIISEPEPKTKKKKNPQRLCKVVAVNQKGLIFARPVHEPKGNMEEVFVSDLNHRRRFNVPEQTPQAENDLEDSPDSSIDSSEESGLDLQVNNDLEEILPKESSPEENKIVLELRKRGCKAKVDLKKVLPKDGSPELNDVYDNVNVKNGGIPDNHLPNTLEVKEVKHTVAKRKTRAKK